MIFLPIVGRELRVASRRGATYWTRTGVALMAVLVSGYIMSTSFRASANAIGSDVFWTLAWLTFAYCMFAGARLTSDSISGEKREGTLGLLFLTDLKGYDVVFGKLAVTSLNAFYNLLAIFPVLAIPLLAGGVSYGEFWRVALVCMNLLFFSLAIGIMASAFCRKAQQGMAVTVLLLLAAAAFFPALGELMRAAHRPFNKDFLLLSPVYACVLTSDEVLQGSPAILAHFWMTVAVTHVYAWLALFVACVVVPRSWQDRPEGAPRRHPLKRWLSRRYEPKRAFRTDALQINPFYWLAARNPLPRIFLWWFLIVVAGIWLWGWMRYSQDWLEELVYILTALLLHTSLKCFIALAAATRFAEDRQSGALELLLSTPVRVEDVLRGQLRALFHQFARPVGVILLIDMVFIFAGPTDESLWPLMWLAGMVIFALDMVALSWISMWLGLNRRSAGRAAWGAVGRIMILPWVVFFMAVLLSSSRMIRIWNDEYAVLYVWFGLAAVNSVVFILWARHNLRAHFREIATERLEHPTWRFLGRMLARPANYFRRR